MPTRGEFITQTTESDSIRMTDDENEQRTAILKLSSCGAYNNCILANYTKPPEFH